MSDWVYYFVDAQGTLRSCKNPPRSGRAIFWPKRLLDSWGREGMIEMMQKALPRAMWDERA